MLRLWGALKDPEGGGVLGLVSAPSHSPSFSEPTVCALAGGRADGPHVSLGVFKQWVQGSDAPLGPGPSPAVLSL